MFLSKKKKPNTAWVAQWVKPKTKKQKPNHILDKKCDSFCPFYGAVSSIADNELAKILSHANLLVSSTKKYSISSTFLSAYL